MLTKQDIQAYLKRIGVTDIQPPTRAYLFELHRAHVQSLPSETVDIFAGRPAPIGLNESVQLILNGRSGYCFHLNAAFSEPLIAYTNSERDELWKKVRIIHEEWKKSKATEQAD